MKGVGTSWPVAVCVTPPPLTLRAGSMGEMSDAAATNVEAEVGLPAAAERLVSAGRRAKEAEVAAAAPAAESKEAPELSAL